MNWLTTTQAATYVKKHVITLRRAANSGDLHGHQGTANGRWTFAEPALDAWCQGFPERTQREKCGCIHLRAVRRTG